MKQTVFLENRQQPKDAPHGRERVLCLKREFPIQLTGEERVRQQLLAEILEIVPKEFVEVEYLIKKTMDIEDAWRADIVVLDEDYDPYLVIECKEPSVALTLTVKEQAERYNAILQAPYIAITNGTDTEIFEEVDTVYKQLTLDEIIDLLNEMAYDYEEDIPLKRLKLAESTSQEVIHEYIDQGNISVVSTPMKRQIYAELYNAILTEPFQPMNMFSFIDEIEDLGYGYYGFGNGSGTRGRFTMDYRNFKVTMNGESIIYRITLAAAGTTANDPVYGNRKGSTGLCVGIQGKAHNAHVLELNLDTFLVVENGQVKITHNGRGLQKYGIIDLMKERTPEMMAGDCILLGQFAVNESINTSAFSQLVESIIGYCYIRAEMKREKKTM